LKELFAKKTDAFEANERAFSEGLKFAEQFLAKHGPD